VTAEQETPAPFPDEASPAATAIQGSRADVDLVIEEPDTEAWQDDLVGLLTLGELHGYFSWCGHKISLRTLRTDEELLVSDLIKSFEGAMGGMKAYATATAGLAVEFIDEQPMPVPLGEDPHQPYKWALQRFNYARRWYPPTIDAILNAYLQLETRQREVLAGLGKASAPGEPAIPGLSGSSGLPTAGDS
jgi:hypothetical protein